MEEEAEIFEPYVVHYSDLVLLSSAPPSLPSSLEERCRLESISGKMMEALGENGPGLLSITGVPEAPRLRQTLLPLARKLALLPNDERARILKDHGLGSDVPLKNVDRSISSFALQLKLPQNISFIATLNDSMPKEDDAGLEKNIESDCFHKCQSFEFDVLGHSFRQLGSCMMGLGIHLARICDKQFGGQELERSILESCSAKGRLIHYHSSLDKRILKQFTGRKKGSNMKPAVPFRSSLRFAMEMEDKVQSNVVSSTKHGEVMLEYGKPEKAEVNHYTASPSELWQQWHYDYGIFTILTTPMFLSLSTMPTGDVKDFSLSSDLECNSPHGHTYLQLFETSKNKIVVVKTEPENFVIQVGESAHILSRGKLCSTLHSVCKPNGLENISRETFVVFMQPSWKKVLHAPEYHLTSEIKVHDSSRHGTEESNGSQINQEDLASENHRKLKNEILGIVPSLSSRLKVGMTFAEFSRETTKQYYGGSGFLSLLHIWSSVLLLIKQPKSLIVRYRFPGMEGGNEKMVIANLQEKCNKGKKQLYAAMYSSFFGGITRDPALMNIPIDDHMIHRGHGVFDTAMILDGYLYELDPHLDRILNSAALAKISPPFSRSTLRNILIQLTAVSRCRKGSLRYWLSAGPGNFLLSSAECSESTFYAIVIEEDYHPHTEGVRVITSSIPMKSPLFATMKNVNYLPNVLSILEAEEKGASASVWVDDCGYVAEGPNVNVAFINKNNELLLPSFDKILGGCTAKRLIDLAKKLVENGALKGVINKDITVQEGKDCAEMMFIGSSLPILPIIAWDDQLIGDGCVGERTLMLSELLWEDMKTGPGTQRLLVPYND